MEQCLTRAAPHAGKTVRGLVTLKGTFRTGREELYEKFTLVPVFPILCLNTFAIECLKLFNFNAASITLYSVCSCLACQQLWKDLFCYCQGEVSLPCRTVYSPTVATYPEPLLRLSELWNLMWRAFPNPAMPALCETAKDQYFQALKDDKCLA